MKKTILSLLAIATVTTAYAVPARRGILTVEQPDGSTIEVLRSGNEFSPRTTTVDGKILTSDANGNLVPAGEITLASSARRSPRHNAPKKQRLVESSFVAKGNVKTLAILVEYSNLGYTIKNPKDYFTRLFNAPDFKDNGTYGSIGQYFRDQSHGMFNPQFDVYGPVVLPNTQRYYGKNDSDGMDMYAHEMAIDACNLLDSIIDFTQYDADNDGYIDNVYIIYPGLGESGYGASTTVWPHSWDIEEAYSLEKFDSYNLILDGKKLNHYACSSELLSGTLPEGIGTICHEFSHVLGLPDLYNTRNSDINDTPCDWSILDQGSYADNGYTPVGYSSFERYSLEWITPVEITDTPANYEFGDLATQRHCGIVRTSKDNEFFLFENRQKTGWDAYIPATGMLAWHIDYQPDKWDKNTVNNTSSHQCVDLLRADNDKGITEKAFAGDPFPGRNNVTSLALKTWAGTRLNVAFSDITESGEILTFKINGGGEQASITGPDTESTPFTVDGRMIYIMADKEFYICDITGRCIAKGNGQSEVTLENNGIYIVNIAGKSHKIAIR